MDERIERLANKILKKNPTREELVEWLKAFRAQCFSDGQDSMMGR